MARVSVVTAQSQKSQAELTWLVGR